MIQTVDAKIQAMAVREYINSAKEEFWRERERRNFWICLFPWRIKIIKLKEITLERN